MRLTAVIPTLPASSSHAHRFQTAVGLAHRLNTDKTVAALMQATTVSSGSAAAEARPPPASSGGEHATQPPAPSNAAPPAMAAAAVTQLPAEAASAEPAAHMPAVTTQPPSDQPPVATVPPPTLPVQSVAAAPANGQPATTAAPSQAAAATTQPAAAGGAAPVLGLTYEAAVERVEGFLRRLAVEHDKEGFFQEKVLTSLRGCEDYYVRIKHPMWFSRMREKASSLQSPQISMIYLLLSQCNRRCLLM